MKVVLYIPIYRYPGNYSGTEWPTHSWSDTSLSIKQAVKESLQPLYIQSMNHCVSTNLYRSGSDRIDHHSDKDLDLNRQGAIVSISLGCTRIMELYLVHIQMLGLHMRYCLIEGCI